MTASGKASSAVDKAKWIFATAVVVIAGYANSHYSADFPMLYRFIALVAIGLLALFLISTTKNGQAFIQLTREARLEMKKVVWPKKNETLITSGFVVAAVMFSSLVLWAVDYILKNVISAILG